MRESQGIATRTNERKAQNPTQKNEVKIKPLRFTMMIQVHDLSTTYPYLSNFMKTWPTLRNINFLALASCFTAHFSLVHTRIVQRLPKWEPYGPHLMSERIDWKGDSCSPICGNISFLESGEAAQAMGNPQFQFCNIIDLIWFDYLPRPPEYLEKWGNLCIVCIYICIHIYI